MSDDRFDQDLRAVLLEDAPGEVPEDLRRRVAAVPATYPVEGRLSGPSWRRPATLWVGAAAALVLVLVAASWWFGPSAQQGVGGLPTPSPAVAPTTSSSPSVAVVSPSAAPVPSPSTSPSSGTTSPTPTPAPSGSVACRAADLQGRILGWTGAAGNRIADVEIINMGANPCFIHGTPGLQMVDSTGRVLIDSAAAGPSGQPSASPGDPKFDVAPGGRLRTQVDASNYCGPKASPPIDIGFTLPSGGGRFVAVPGAGVSSADAVPLCMGSTGSAISMNGWTR